MILEDKFTRLLRDAAVSVFILGNEAMTDVELVRLSPAPIPDDEVQRRIAGRDLKFVGVAGIYPNGQPCTALEQPLPRPVLDSLAAAFIPYCEPYFAEGIAAQQPGGFVEFARKLWALPDTRD
jgi:hypothetical protein